jgi:hypothetical protein
MFELMSKVKVDASDGNTAIHEFEKAGQFESFTTSTKQQNDMKSAAEI